MLIPEFTLTKSEQMHGDAECIRQSILEHLHFTLCKDRYTATKRDLFHATAYAVRDQLMGRWLQTQQQYYDADVKRVYYLSLEFLMGQTLKNSLVNLGLYENCQKALHDIEKELDDFIQIEEDAGLGNGGLGRLAACFLDSMATLNIPGYGYGIRYDYGIFTQKIQNGFQIEKPDNWLRYGNPWEICRSEYLYPVHFYGNVIQYTDEKRKEHSQWVDTEEVMAMAYDTPIPGYKNDTVNTLRLWQAKSPRGFNLNYFNHGDYMRAAEDIALSENITKVLYPNDNIFEGKELRLKQEYLLVSATLQDIIRRYNKGHIHLDHLSDKVAIQLNDTHPALAIAEMMHLLVDREELSWEKSWELTTNVFGYTNHTLLPEALERWPVSLLQHVLPRHLQIIHEINKRWLNEVSRHFPNDPKKTEALSIIEEDTVNMAHLAIVGARKVNGVSKLHSQLLKEEMFASFYAMYPEKFTNKTNGITPRRWLKMCNPALASLITEHIGEQWVTNLALIKKLAPLKEEASFREKWKAVKRANKEKLAQLIFAESEIEINPNSIFDCHIKRLHEYKRQHLNILHVISLYLRIKQDPKKNWTPRTVIFSGKAAPGYFLAKRIIKLITAVAELVNEDAEVSAFLKVIFMANYRVSLAEVLIPAADLSEQISTAGTEASGTGNMKFALNGALTIGTLDGANIEMKEEIHEENMFLFGLKAEEVKALKSSGYKPWEYYERDPHLKEVLDTIRDGFFSGGDTELFKPIIDSVLTDGDPYCLLADFKSYIEKQNEVSEAYQDQELWTKRSILNAAGSGLFSSDRTIQQYAEEIWRLD